METQIIKFSEIDVDEYWMTRPTNPEDIGRISELISLAEYPPPMIVCRVGTRYLLLDGFDRYEAWRRSLNGFDGEVSVLIADCQDEKSRFTVAVEANIKNARNYTIGQIGELYTRLTKNVGFSKKEARKLLRLTEEHAQKFEIIRMEATTEEVDTPEPPAPKERAANPESSVNEECAAGTEIPIENERAEAEETPVVTEGVDYNTIRFHIERLPKLVPPMWTDVHQTLGILTSQVIKHMQEENQK